MRTKDIQIRSPQPESREIDRIASEWVARKDAGLSAAEELEWKSWIKADRRHQSAWDRLTAAWEMIDRPRTTGAADWLISELKHRQRRRRQRRMTLSATGIAALAVLAFFLRAPESGSPLAPPQLAVSDGLERRVLPDGSLAQVKSGAIFSTDFSGSLRQVIVERGAVHFQVARDPQRPFVVKARSLSVRAVGTEFSVELGQTAVEILVTEGRVSVERPAPTAQSPAPPATYLSASQGLIVQVEAEEASAVRRITGPEWESRIAWHTPKLEFTGTPLAEAIATLNRYNRVQFVIEDPSLGELRVSGLFQANNTDVFVRLLEASVGVTAEPLGDATLLLRRAP